MRLVTGKDALVAKWVELHIPSMLGGAGFGPCTAIGVVNANEQPVAGVVFHDYQPHLRSVQISCAAETPRWLTKKLAGLIMAYPFSQLGCTRVTAITPSGTKASASRFLERFGFVREGVIRKGLGDSDAVIWGMLDTDWAASKFNVASIVDGQEKHAPSPYAGRSRRARQRAIRKQYRIGARTAAPQHDQHGGA